MVQSIYHPPDVSQEREDRTTVLGRLPSPHQWNHIAQGKSASPDGEPNVCPHLKCVEIDVRFNKCEEINEVMGKQMNKIIPGERV